ncbi:MAG: alanine racemase [Chloroflexi bacterium]|nr:alanine racemase [Chloroflexota bacterium]
MAARVDAGAGLVPPDRYAELDTPVALVELDVLQRNLGGMAERARRAGVRLRPHVKTHKSTWIARLQIEGGARGVTVAKLGEAEVMADAGIDDILVAFPMVGRAKLERLRRLAERVNVIVALDDLDVALGLGEVGRGLARPLEVYVDVDSGLHRTGRAPGAASAALALEVAKIPGLRVRGLMTHAGQSYGARGAAVERVAVDEARALADTAAALADGGLSELELSAGSTPTAFFCEAAKAAVPSLTEVRPGTYAFNDVNQVTIGVAEEADCALTILATVVGRQATDRMIVDAGSKTLGGEAGVGPGHGRVKGDPTVQIERLSEEHGWCRVPPGSSWKAGDRLEIIPNHVCLVPNLVGEMVGVRGGRAERAISVEARGMNR